MSVLTSLLFSACAVNALVRIPVDPGPATQSAAIPPSFVSFSIELIDLPSFAGNKAKPNTFSDNLLTNLGKIMGSRPILRVGGNTQDQALYDSNLPEAVKPVPVDGKYPSAFSIGKSFFESYGTFKDTQFVHGFNLGKNGLDGANTLNATVPLACEALRGKLAFWELGNEPDLYRRPRGWNEQSYVDEWRARERIIKDIVGQSCPEEPYKYMAPSFAGTKHAIKPVPAWDAGLNRDNVIGMNSMHMYMGNADDPGVTLQASLMNHGEIVKKVAPHIDTLKILAKNKIPYILGEFNSLARGGKLNLSNTFGAALWGLDFNLWCASQGIARTHMHTSVFSPYTPWVPIDTSQSQRTARPPYYGSIAVATTLGNLKDHETTVSNLPLEDDKAAAYAAYEDGQLARLTIVNMAEFRSTAGERPSETYKFKLGKGNFNGTRARVARLMAAGSDALDGVTFDGYSYGPELNDGKPVLVPNVQRGETIDIGGCGEVTVKVPFSSAAVISLDTETEKDDDMCA